MSLVDRKNDIFYDILANVIKNVTRDTPKFGSLCRFFTGQMTNFLTFHHRNVIFVIKWHFWSIDICQCHFRVFDKSNDKFELDILKLNLNFEHCVVLIDKNEKILNEEMIKCKFDSLINYNCNEKVVLKGNCSS